MTNHERSNGQSQINQSQRDQGSPEIKVPTVILPVHGDYYFEPVTNQFRSQIMEKQEQIEQGKY